MQSQVRFNRVPEKVWEAWLQGQVRFNGTCGHLIHGNPAEVFPALGFAARFKKSSGCWGYHPSLFFPVPSKNTGSYAVFTMLQDVVSICEKDKNTIFYAVCASRAQQKIVQKSFKNSLKSASKSIL